jgi:zinc protease
LPLLLVLACTPKAPPAPAAEEAVDASLDAPLAFDPDVHRGTFDNGLRWFIEENHEPQQRAVLRLVVDAGSALEDDDQQGLAHVLEHMAFNGTEHFPANELITYLEGVGARFGPHLNAHTSFDETVYKLTVPTDDPEIYANAFQVLEDWADGMTLDPEEIEKERGVVIEEWRTRLNAGGRVREVTAPLIYHDARYADRMPIGTKESLESFTPEAVARFYADWYRPELMSVIVVGDVDPDATKALLEQHFASLENPPEPRERLRFPIPDHDETFYAIVADPEITRVGISMVAKHDDVEGQTARDYRDDMVAGLGVAILNKRLAELARQADAPFLRAGVGPQRLGPTEGADSIGVSVREDAMIEGFEAAWTEVERARRHGVTAGELERAVASRLRRYEQLIREKDTTDSSNHVGELVRHVLHGETVPGIDAEAEMAERWLPAITVEEVNASLRDFLTEGSRVVTAVLPDKEGLTPPTDAELAAVLERVAAAELAPPVEDEALPEHIVDVPEPGSIVRVDDTYQAELGFTGWVLSNGVKVYFRATDFKNDQVLWRSFGPGGSALVRDEDYIPTITADDVIYASGYGSLDTNLLRRWLTGTSVSARHSMGTDTHGTSGSASPDNLGTALELLHASLVAPRLSDDGLTYVQQQKVESIRNRLQSPDTVFGDAWTATLWPEVDRWKPWTLDDVDAMEIEGSKEAWARFHGDATGDTYAFVGNLPDDFEAQVLTWIGSLPASGEALPDTPLGVEPAPGSLEVVVEQGMEERASVKLAWHAPFPLDEQTWLARGRLYAMGSVLRTQLREELREEMGGVYGVGASASNWTDPPWAITTVSFTCDPERVDELVEAVRTTVASMIEAPVEARYVDQLKEQNRRSREESVRSNSFWLGGLLGALERGEDPHELLTWDARNDSLSPEEVHAAAKRWLDVPNTVEAVLLPAEPEDDQD